MKSQFEVNTGTGALTSCRRESRREEGKKEAWISTRIYSAHATTASTCYYSTSQPPLTITPVALRLATLRLTPRPTVRASCDMLKLKLEPPNVGIPEPQSPRKKKLQMQMQMQPMARPAPNKRRAALDPCSMLHALRCAKSR